MSRITTTQAFFSINLNLFSLLFSIFQVLQNRILDFAPTVLCHILTVVRTDAGRFIIQIIIIITRYHFWIYRVFIPSIHKYFLQPCRL